MDNPPCDDDAIRAHADLVYRTCRRLTGNDQDAADVSQEVFIAWMTAAGSIRGPLGAWLHGTARRRALDFLRRGHRRQRHEGAVDPHPAEDRDAGWQLQLDDALADLDRTSRALVIEHHLLGVDQGRLAERFRCTQATVSRRLARAMRSLRLLLERRGVSLAPALAPFDLAHRLAQPGCPAGLLAPVLAQARIGGSAALLGPALLSLGVSGWTLAAAIAALAVVVIGVVGALWWQATAIDISRDWTAQLAADLPAPAPGRVLDIQPPGTGPRYPSIERLIAGLPEVDAALQERLNALCSGEGSPLGVLKMRYNDHMSGAPANPGAGQRQWAEVSYPVISPVLQALQAGDLLLPGASTLATDYRAGRLGSLTLRSAWVHPGHRLQLERSQLAATMARILIIRAKDAADASATTELDAVVAAQRRSILTLLDGMTALALHDWRDALYLRLIYANRVGEATVRRWCAEACPVQDALISAMAGEALLIDIPYLDDVRAGRPVEGATAYLDLRFMAWQAAWLPENFSSLRDVLHGVHSTVFHRLAGSGWLAPQPMVLSALHGIALAVAEGAGAHRARRTAAELLLAVRAGRALPEEVASLADGPADAWKVRYERLSPMRFRLVVDRSAGLPAAAEESKRSRVADTLDQPTRLAASTDGVGFRDHGIQGIEIAVPAPGASIAVPPPEPMDEEVGPPAPHAAQ